MKYLRDEHYVISSMDSEHDNVTSKSPGTQSGTSEGNQCRKDLEFDQNENTDDLEDDAIIIDVSSGKLFEAKPNLITRKGSGNLIPSPASFSSLDLIELDTHDVTRPRKDSQPLLKEENAQGLSCIMSKSEELPSSRSSVQTKVSQVSITTQGSVESNRLSPTQSPVIQVMEPSGGYDPHRIPLKVFESSQPTTPYNWSTASNESLFSLHLGSLSLPRDHAFKSPELFKSGELIASSLSLVVESDNMNSDLEQNEEASTTTATKTTLNHQTQRCRRIKKKKKKKKCMSCCYSSYCSRAFCHNTWSSCCCRCSCSCLSCCSRVFCYDSWSSCCSRCSCSCSSCCSLVFCIDSWSSCCSKCSCCCSSYCNQAFCCDSWSSCCCRYSSCSHCFFFRWLLCCNWKRCNKKSSSSTLPEGVTRGTAKVDCKI